MTASQFAKSLSSIAREFTVDPKTFKSLLETHEICLPKGPVLAPYQKWIYEWIAYPPEVKKEDYAEVELPLHWMEKCKKRIRMISVKLGRLYLMLELSGGFGRIREDSERFYSLLIKFVTWQTILANNRIMN